MVNFTWIEQISIAMVVCQDEGLLSPQAGGKSGLDVPGHGIACEWISKQQAMETTDANAFTGCAFFSQNNLRDSIVSEFGSLKVVEFGEHKAL